jgi:hypothetical protein
LYLLVVRKLTFFALLDSCVNLLPTRLPSTGVLAALPIGNAPYWHMICGASLCSTGVHVGTCPREPAHFEELILPQGTFVASSTPIATPTYASSKPEVEL